MPKEKQPKLGRARRRAQSQPAGATTTAQVIGAVLGKPLVRSDFVFNMDEESEYVRMIRTLLSGDLSACVRGEASTAAANEELAMLLRGVVANTDHARDVALHEESVSLKMAALFDDLVRLQSQKQMPPKLQCCSTPIAC